MMTPKLGIIADDFTGALLVAGILEAEGIDAPVFFGPEGMAQRSPGEVPIIATRTRVAPVGEALGVVAQCAAALKAAGCPRLSYKACASFDSTELGNIGPAGNFLSAKSGGAPMLLSAGFPKYNATVHQGYLFYRGRLVSESIKKMDPLTPMNDPDLVRFLSRQTGAPVSLLPHRILLRGREAAVAEWERLLVSGARHVLADTSDDFDVEMTAHIAVNSEAVVVASDPLIVEFAKALAGPRQAAARSSGRLASGPGAVIVGSVGPVAEAQVASFARDHEVLLLDPLDPRDEAAVIAAALDWAQPRIGEKPFGIVTVTDPAGTERAQAALGQMGAARKVERLLAGVASGLQERGIRRLVVSGGETSGAVVTALGVPWVRALPEGPLGSGFCVAEAPVPMALFLKSGKIGPDDILAAALDALRC